MDQLIYYLFEYGIFIMSFYLLYLFLFKGKKDHQFNRFYLISSSVMCLIIPLLPNSFSVSSEQFFSVLLEPIEIGAKGTAKLVSQGNDSIPLIAILSFLYLFVTAVLIFRFLFGLNKIRKVQSSGTKSIFDNNFVIESEEIEAPFSFFNHIYIPKKGYTDAEKELIIKHELTHIKFGHSTEKILFLLSKVFFWWNPINHRYFEELELVHEYQVDEKLCANSSKKTYSIFLLSQINTQSQYKFVNNISSHIKNRIIMISSNKKSTPSILKWGSYLSLCVLALFLHACDVESDDPLIEDNYKQFKKVEEVRSETGEYETIEVLDTVVTFDAVTKEESFRIVKSNQPVYKVPEVMPVFGDCNAINEVEAKYECSNQKLLEFIYKNITYPSDAKENGVQGMNVVQFVVNKTGGISHVENIKSIGHGTDEAIQVVLDKMKEANLWTAGRQNGENVATRFTLPIKFKLED